MERFIKGDIVVVPFPFSDLSSTKKRPAFVIVDLKGDDIILCQITSHETRDQYSIAIGDGDYKNGKLPVSSNIKAKSHLYSGQKYNPKKSSHS